MPTSRATLAWGVASRKQPGIPFVNIPGRDHLEQTIWPELFKQEPHGLQI
jgi:hypothetical protein